MYVIVVICTGNTFRNKLDLYLDTSRNMLLGLFKILWITKQEAS